MKPVSSLFGRCAAVCALVLSFSLANAAAPARQNPYQVDAQKAGDTRLTLGFEFTDSGDSYTVELRRSILEIVDGPIAAGTPKVSLSTAELRAVLAGEPAPAGSGDSKTLARLLAYLDRTQTGFYMHVR